jgi:hypothetical protein
MSQAVVRDTSLWCARRITAVLRAAGGPPETIELARPFARIGSHPDCEIVLPAQDAPPLAVYLHAMPAGGYGIKLAHDEIEIHAAGRGRRGGLTARIGRHTLDVRFTRDEADVAESSAPTNDGPAGSLVWPRLEIEVPGERAPIVRRLSRVLTVVGRQPPSRLLLRHATVARTHSVLHWDGARLWVVNLLSPNGTRLVLPFARLGSHWIDSGEVRLGDGLMLGDVRVRYIDVVEAEVRPPATRGPRHERRRAAELAERCRQVEARCRRLARIAGEFRRQAETAAAAVSKAPPDGPVIDASPEPSADPTSGEDAETRSEAPAEVQRLAPETDAGPQISQAEPPQSKTGEAWSHERLIDAFVAERRQLRRRRLLWTALLLVPLLAIAGWLLTRPEVLDKVEPLGELWREIVHAFSAR